VVLLHLSNVDTETTLNILENVAPEAGGDSIVEIDRHTVVLIKQIDEQEDFEELEQLGMAIESTFISETSYPVHIGIGEPKKSLALLSESFREARKAIDVGRVYRPDNTCSSTASCCERFLADISPEMSQKYNMLMFNRKTARLFNEEMLHTIEKFFENSLNLSETARQIYIHRNTLVYRLDKVQRIIGLDLRSFADAVPFKMMMLLGKTGEHKNRI
jgi:carbohydrate diacid regulator